MRFRGSTDPPPFLNRKDQFRLLGLVGLLTFILIAMKVAAQPETWRWMFPAENSAHAPEQNRRRQRKQIDHRVRIEDEPHLKPGEFISRRTAEPAQTSSALPAAGSAVASARTETLRFDPRLFENVRDNTLGVRHDEAAAYRTVLKRIRTMQPTELERVGKHVSYTVLMLDAERYRGRPITLEGRLHRLLPLPTRGESSRSDPLYEAWLFTADSGTDPYRVVCVEVDDRLPVGKELQPPPRVRVTGLFFKRQGYASRGGLHVAPLLLARRLHLVIPPPVTQPHVSLVPWIAGLALLIGGTLVIAQWRFTRGDRAFADGCLKQITTATPAAIDALEEIETVDPNDIFRQLGSEDAGTDAT